MCVLDVGVWLAISEKLHSTLKRGMMRALRRLVVPSFVYMVLLLLLKKALFAVVDVCSPMKLTEAQ